MRKIGIYCGSEDVKIIDDSIEFIAVDKGYDYLVKKNITPILAVGDFDSIENDLNIEVEKEVLPVIKDATDTHYAVEKALVLGYDSIDLYGVTGGRLDHFMAVMRLLANFKDVDITIYDNYNKIYVLNKGNHRIEKQNYKYLSFFALNKVTISIEGVTYPLNHYALSFDDSLCVSNEIIKQFCLIELDNDVYVIQSNDKYGN